MERRPEENMGNHASEGNHQTDRSENDSRNEGDLQQNAQDHPKGNWGDGGDWVETEDLDGATCMVDQNGKLNCSNQ